MVIPDFTYFYAAKICVRPVFKINNRGDRRNEKETVDLGMLLLSLECLFLCSAVVPQGAADSGQIYRKGRTEGKWCVLLMIQDESKSIRFWPR